MTNRELLNLALPIKNLSSKEWEEIIAYSETETTVKHIIKKMLVNQARIEVIGNYNDYYFDRLEEEI